MSKQPYLDTHNDPHTFVRCFPETVNVDELVWHRDHYNRTVTVIKSEGWKFQHDNEIPFDLEEGSVFEIAAGMYHRLIKGKGSLILEIHEHR